MTTDECFRKLEDYRELRKDFKLMLVYLDSEETKYLISKYLEDCENKIDKYEYMLHAGELLDSAVL